MKQYDDMIVLSFLDTFPSLTMDDVKGTQASPIGDDCDGKYPYPMPGSLIEGV